MKKRILKDESERLGVPVEKQREYVEKLSKLINCKTVFTKNGENDCDIVTPTIVHILSNVISMLGIIFLL